jgi:cytochrome b6-f complex iron-sulfur subunit
MDPSMSGLSAGRRIPEGGERIEMTRGTSPGRGEGAAPTIPGRRRFLRWVTAGWAMFAATSFSAAFAAVRFLFPDDPSDPPVRFKAGRPGDLAPGGVDGRWKGSRGIWVVREGRRIFALSSTCTHLGCSLEWASAEGKFKCPCHGSGFTIEGLPIEGPAPRALPRYRVAVAADGRIEVDVSRKYQEELGQWNDPDSFLVTGP